MIGLLVSVFAFAACSKDDGEDGDKSFSMDYSGKGHEVIWDWDEYGHGLLRLEFGLGIPVGSEWYIEGVQPWTKLSMTHDKVPDARSKMGDGPWKNYVIIEIPKEKNENYEDRTANLQLKVPNGAYSYSSNLTTVSILQYGYEHYLSGGPHVTFITNRGKSTGRNLVINDISIPQIMEIDWGDGTKEVIKDYINTGSISHFYSSWSDIYILLKFVLGNAIQVVTIPLRLVHIMA